jgi:transcriptional regulator with XRE-family HTH domain
MSKRTEFWMKGRKRLAEPFLYSACALDNIYLLNGVTIENTSYGPMVNIENLNELHRAIGLHIIEKPDSMVGAEFRKQMGLTQAKLACLMRVSEQTIANYEKGKTADLGPADPFMRLAYLLHIVPDDTGAQPLKKLAARSGIEATRLPDVSRRKIVQGWRTKAIKIKVLELPRATIRAIRTATLSDLPD